MADNTDNKATTGAVTVPWQEPFSRYQSVKGDRSLQSAGLDSQFAGSWAAQYFLGDHAMDGDTPLTPAMSQALNNQLGHPGMPEINFRPYDFGTNRQGVNGPSLMGHPISFEVVGPTLKTRSLDHFWDFIPGAGVTGDKLVLNLLDSVFSTAIANVPPTQQHIGSIYAQPTGEQDNLYLVIAQGGGTANTFGLGDGTLPGTVLGGTTYDGIIAKSEQSKYEIFRVVHFDTDTHTITLDYNKRVSTFFTIPGVTPVIRAVTLIRPVATRMVAVPNSGPAVGREQSFVAVAPARALWDDSRPAYRDWITDGGFDPLTDYDTSGAFGSLGHFDDWDYAPRLPTGKPVKVGDGHVQEIAEASFSVLETGRMRLIVDAGLDSGDGGMILHLHSLEVFNQATLMPVGPVGFPIQVDHEALLGWYEILEVGVDYYDVRRLTEWDPDKGTPFYGDGRIWQLETPVAPNDKIALKWSLHPPVSSLWSQTALLTDHLDAARLTNLIDPDQAHHSTKVGLGSPGAVGGTPDKAVFDTSTSGTGTAGTNANPGSLLDLGFRMVVFPARWSRLNPGLEPDWDRPLTSRELILDETVKTAQWMDIDYAAGTVTLSHPPLIGAGLVCDVCPDPTTIMAVAGESANIRGEVVLFACCVPYSREPTQSGAGLRIMGDSQDLDQDSAAACGDVTNELADVYGHRRFWKLLDGKTITSGAQANDIWLDQRVSLDELPPQGFVELIDGLDHTGSPMWVDAVNGLRSSIFGYTRVEQEVVGPDTYTVLKGCYGGAAAIDPGKVVHGAVAVLRRAVVTPSDGLGRVGTHLNHDVTYGQALRSNTVAFEEAEVVVDRGVIRVRVQDSRVGEHSKLFDAAISAWILSGGNAVGETTPTLTIRAAQVHINGRYYEVPETAFTASVIPADNNYFYVDGTTAVANNTCPEMKVTGTLPLPGAHDILLCRATSDGFNHSWVADLRRMLNRLDRRDVITVGDTSSPQTIATVDGSRGPHFSTLTAAISYANEIGNPFGVGAVAGPHQIIRVVGPTDELPANLPIPITVDGLIIEGASRRQDSTLGSTTVGWTGEKFLFDVGDAKNLVFRDLAFEYRGIVVPVDINHGVFTTILGDGENLLIENCVLSGLHEIPACLLAFLPTDPENWIGLTVRGCRGMAAESVVYLNPNVSIRDLNVQANVFKADSPTEGYGAVEGLGKVVSSTVRDNNFELYARGVNLVGGHINILDNEFTDTIYEGVRLEPPGAGSYPIGCQVTGNTFQTCHSDNTLLPLAIVYTMTEMTTVADNQLGFSGVVVDPGACLIRALMGYSVVTGNKAIRKENGLSVSVGGIEVGDNGVISNNALLESSSLGFIKPHNHSEVTGNSAGTLVLPSERVTDLLVTNNRFYYSTDGVVEADMADSRFTGNHFGQPWDLQAYNSAWQNNFFQQSFTLWSNKTAYNPLNPTEYGNNPLTGAGVMKTANIFSGNTVEGGLVVESSQTKVQDNIVTGVVTSRTIKHPTDYDPLLLNASDLLLGIFVFGDHITVSGNTVTAGMQVGTSTSHTEVSVGVGYTTTAVHGLNNVIVSDNKIGNGTVATNGVPGLIAGTDCGLFVWADQLTCSSNYVAGTAWFGGWQMSLTGNQFGDYEFVGTGTVYFFAAFNLTMTGNTFLDCKLQNAFFTDFAVPANAQPHNCTVNSPAVFSGNTIGVGGGVGVPPSTFTLDGGIFSADVGCVFTGNYVVGLTVVKQRGAQLTGNRFLNNVTFEASAVEPPRESIFRGNRVAGDLTLHGSGHEITGNVLRDTLGVFHDIVLDSTCLRYRLTDNLCNKVRDVGNAPVDPDAVNGIAQGNDLRGGVGASWFTGALPGIVGTRAHNKDV